MTLSARLGAQHNGFAIFLKKSPPPASYLIRICRHCVDVTLLTRQTFRILLSEFTFLLPAGTTEPSNGTSTSHRDKNSQTENRLPNNQTSGVITEDDGECFLLTCRREGNSNPYQSPLNFLCFSNCMKHFYVLWYQGSSFAFRQKPR